MGTCFDFLLLIYSVLFKMETCFDLLLLLL